MTFGTMTFGTMTFGTMTLGTLTFGTWPDVHFLLPEFPGVGTFILTPHVYIFSSSAGILRCGRF